MEKIIDFLEKITQVTNETGVIIETFGDAFYDPALTDETQYGMSSVPKRVYISYDIEAKTYVGRLNDPYNGKVIFPTKERV